MAHQLGAVLQGPGSSVASEIDAMVEHVIATLNEQQVLTAMQIDRGRRAAATSGERLDLVLNKLGMLSDHALQAAYERVTNVKPAKVGEKLHCIELDGVDPQFLKNARMVPVDLNDTSLMVAVADPIDVRAAMALAAKFGRSLELVALPRAEIDAALAPLLKGDSNVSSSSQLSLADVGTDDIERLRDIASEAPIIRLVSEIIESAIVQGASDVHITRNAEGGRARLRIDGQLTDYSSLTPQVHQAVVSRLKIMAALDIGERRLPQDGRIQLAVKGREIDLRISTMPHAHGEGAFVRVLDNKTAILDLDNLGFAPSQTAAIRQIVGHAHGLFLITGPTGSGKTTTLYAALRLLNDPTKHIVTVEDPVEYTLPGVNQIQVNRKAGLDFAKTLRSVLRQDPDIIMIGEIRDRETAAIAVQSALTGHFVLATLHTNDAISAIDRLIDMEVEPFLLSGVLRGLMAQRLVRKSCPHCNRVDHDTTAPGKARPISCQACGGSGFTGRIPLAEIVPVGTSIQNAISERKGSRAISTLAKDLGYFTLQDAGREMIKAGLTTQAEVLRALGE